MLRHTKFYSHTTVVTMFTHKDFTLLTKYLITNWTTPIIINDHELVELIDTVKRPPITW